MLTVGTRFGSYEVTAQIGAGGMGEVYRATDTKLKRQVAIKILPPSLADDHDRLARFQREAEVLASLNHPNIAAIYGLEEGPAEAGHHIRALVMELVEGEDLSQKLEGLRAKGSGLPIDEVLPIAKQIADALEAAHEQGIIHRDLKPANIKVRSDGTVKVLDFGLAKAIEGAGRAGAETHAQATTIPAMTQAGMILGTAAYMAPEQAKGRPADKRADIWAFGVVVFEMLAGQRPFTGETISDTLASVLKTDPTWRALPPVVPPSLRRLLRWCLDKDPKRRLQAIGDARVQIEDLLSGAPEEMPTARGAPSPPVAATRRRIIAAASVTLLVIATALTTWALMRTPLAMRQPIRFAIVPPAAQPLAISGSHRDLALSPDGTHLVYVSGGGQLMVRAIEQLDAVPLGGITGASSPFFSPDGRWIGFFMGNDSELKKVSVAGGPPLLLCQYQGSPRGASWGPDDTIVFATDDLSSGLLRVSAAGGKPTALTTPDAAHGELDHVFPSVLPGGRAVLFTITAPGAIDTAQVAVLDLTTGQRTTLVRGGSQAEYVDLSTPSTRSGQTGSGQGHYLVYALAGTLRAVRFDLVTRTVGSDPVPVVEQVMTHRTGAAEFSVSRQGALVYVPGGATGATRSLVWVTRQGKETPIMAPPRAYRYPRLSPDGTRVALDIFDQDNDIWIWDLARQTLTRLTDSPAFDGDPVWTPDGRRIIFASGRAGSYNLFWQAADNTGSVERLTTSPNTQFPAAISPDGTRLIVWEVVPKTTGGDLRVLRLEASAARPGAIPATPLAAGPRRTEPLLQTTFTKQNGEISPDGRWLAYQSNESGPFQISVRPFPNVDGGHWQISPSGGTRPVWARNGKELFYLDGTNALTAVSVRTAPTFSADTPTKLFDGRYVTGLTGRAYDVSPDGQRFLMIKDNAEGDQPSMPASLVVVLNWLEELKTRVPAK